MSEASSSAVLSAANEEKRQAYGTAKTENLRDSGLWRVLLPAMVASFIAALVLIPGVMLFMLSMTALKATDPVSANLIYLWIVMAVVTIGLAIVISWGFGRIFFTQAANYPKK